jgi:hypothetical protein
VNPQNQEASNPKLLTTTPHPCPSVPPAFQEGMADVAMDDMSFFMPTGNDAEFLQWLDNASALQLDEIQVS